MKTGIGQSKYRNLTLFHVVWSVPAKVFLTVTFANKVVNWITNYITYLQLRFWKRGWFMSELFLGLDFSEWHEDWPDLGKLSVTWK